MKIIESRSRPTIEKAYFFVSAKTVHERVFMYSFNVSTMVFYEGQIETKKYSFSDTLPQYERPGQGVVRATTDT